MTYPIPDAALDDRLGWLGTSGSGKTYNAGGGVERLLRSGARVVIIDPLGVWWGLRLLADGKTASPFDVAILGGPHGDLPLNEHAGALIGETAATMAESCIVDLSELGTKAADRRFMTAFLDSLYRKATSEPFHLVVDEADLFAPQKPHKGDEVLLGLMEQIVRRGRVKGFIPWLISQRPAVLNKNVLSQVDALIAFKLTATQDRDALDDWIEGQADKAQGKAIKDSLPTLPVGTGVVWIPGRAVLTTAAFPVKATFDSSRTPKRGEKRQRRDLRPLDLGKLKEKLASVEEEAKANDPRLLRAEIAELRRKLAAAERGSAPAWPDQREEVARLVDELRQCTAAMDRLREAAEEMNRRHQLAVKALGGDPVTIPEIPVAPARGAPAPPSREPSRKSDLSSPPPATRQARLPRPEGDVDAAVPHGCAKPLAALAGVYPAGMTEAQWATAAGYKRKGGTWQAYRGRLIKAALVEKRDGLFFATETGAGAVGEVELPPAPGPELARWWARKIHGTPKLVEALIEAWPHPLTRDELAERVEMTARGGSFQAYVGRLRSPGLIEGGTDEIRLSAEVMGE